MANPSGPRAGGIFLAVAILLGALIGSALRQPTIGVLAGTAAGLLATLALWWRDQRRR